MTLHRNRLWISLWFILLYPVTWVEPTVSSPKLVQQVPRSSETPETKPETTPTPRETQPELSPEEIRHQKFVEADKLYLEGQTAAAEKLYREVKTPFPQEFPNPSANRLDPVYDPAQLSPAAHVYLRQAEEGLRDGFSTKILIPLQLLVQEFPQFIPGYLQLADALKNYDSTGAALDILEQGSNLYPNETPLLKAKIAALARADRWLEAALTARQFSLMNPQHPEAAEFAKVADEQMKQFRSHLRSQLRGNAIADAVTSVVGIALTGNPFQALSAVQTIALLMMGESGVGENLADAVKDRFKLVEDPEIVDYVDRMGQKLAKVSGRDEFKYEFHIVLDEQLNAFALPGGKIFINAGAIAQANSEAELAGLLAHELAHAALSHGFQLVAEGNLMSKVTQFIPLGGTITDLIILNYSRDMERQADVLGTRILTAAGYAADGLYNLMVTLEKQQKNPAILAWLSTHPDTKERVSSLQKLIITSGYNRYAYEGVAHHSEIQARVKKMLEEHAKKDKK